jgi:hypothetical protein
LSVEKVKVTPSTVAVKDAGEVNVIPPTLKLRGSFEPILNVRDPVPPVCSGAVPGSVKARV